MDAIGSHTMASLCAPIPDSTRSYTFYTAQQNSVYSVVEEREASAAAVAEAFCKPSEFHYAVCPLLARSHIAISDDSRRCGVSPRRRDAPGRCVSLGCDARRMNQGDAASRRAGK